METVKRPARWVWNAWLSYPWTDYLLVALIVVTHGVLVRAHVATELLSDIPMESRPGLYGASAIVVSLTGTLATVSVAQYLGGKGARMAHLKAHFPGQLASTWKAAFFGSLFVVATFLVAYGLDSRTNGTHLGTWLFETAAILALLRFTRLAKLFGDLVEILALDETDPMSDAGFNLRADFFAGSAPK